jgi:hypothetical protein
VIIVFRKTSRYFFNLLYLVLLFQVSGYFILNFSKINLSYKDYSTLVFCFAVITFFVLLVYVRGSSRDKESQTLHILAALGIKFLAEIVLALIWFFVSKKNSVPSVIIFFVLYLAFSLFSIFLMLNTLKNKYL